MEHAEPSDIHDVIAVMMKRLGRNLDREHTTIDFASDLPLIKIDFALIEYAVSSIALELLGQSVQSGVRIAAAREGRKLALIMERGNGHLNDETLRVLENQPLRPLGEDVKNESSLFLAKRLIEVHGGELRAQNNVGGGIRFFITLPA